MKRRHFIFGLMFVLCLFISSCTIYQTVKSVEKYNDNVCFTINRVSQQNTIAIGGGYLWASTGFTFFIFKTSFTNKTLEKQELDFNEIYLVDVDNKNKHKLEICLLGGPITINARKQISLSPRESLNRELVFLYPIDKRPEFVLVNNNLVKIKYRE